MTGRSLAVWVLVLSVAAGALSTMSQPAQAGGALWVIACLALALPCLVSVWLLLSCRIGIVPLLVSLGLMLLFLPRLLTIDPANGLLAAAQLAPGEYARGLATAEIVLIVFSAFLAGGIVLAGRHPTVLARRAAARAPGAATILERTVRVRAALVVGLVSSGAALVNGMTQGVAARDFENAGSAGPLGLLSTGPAGAALWLAGWRRSALLVLAMSVAGPFLTGGRQAVLTPILYFMAAVVVRYRASPDRPGLSRTTVLACAALAAVVVAAAVVATTTRRAEVDTAINQGVRPSIYASVVERQTLLDPLVVAAAREERPQGLRIYSRALAIPIPRMLWPDKPLSYDVSFRERQFPQYGGGIPITLAGTAFLSFLLPGVALAALLLGLGAVTADLLLSARTSRSVLLGVTLCLFLLDTLRIGGLYREFLTSGIDLALIMAVTRSTRWPDPRDRRDDRPPVSTPELTAHSSPATSRVTPNVRHGVTGSEGDCVR